MLTIIWVILRDIHFVTLMLVFGCALYSAWLASAPIRRLMMRRFLRLQRMAAAGNFLATVMMLAVQAGLMGSGWQDVISLTVWGAVLQTQFGGVWLWQMILALVMWVALLVMPRNLPRLLLLLAIAQFCLLAGVGHATLHSGVPGALQRTNHALHLIAAATWFGGLLPVIYCIRIAKGRWYQQAIATMMRFSRYGHFAVALVLLTGIANVLFIQGFSQFWHAAWGQLLLLKSALVGLMVVIALLNRYVLVPRMPQDSRRMSLYFIWMTKIEWAIGAVVLTIVSLFATLEPF